VAFFFLFLSFPDTLWHILSKWQTPMMTFSTNSRATDQSVHGASHNWTVGKYYGVHYPLCLVFFFYLFERRRVPGRAHFQIICKRDFRLLMFDSKYIWARHYIGRLPTRVNRLFTGPPAAKQTTTPPSGFSSRRRPTGIENILKPKNTTVVICIARVLDHTLHVVMVITRRRDDRHSCPPWTTTVAATVFHCIAVRNRVDSSGRR